MDYLSSPYIDFFNNKEVNETLGSDIVDTTSSASDSIDWGSWLSAFKVAGSIASNIIQLKAMEHATSNETEKAELRQQIALLERKQLEEKNSAPESGIKVKTLAIGGTVAAGLLALIALR